MKVISDQLDLELTSYLDDETSVEVIGRENFVKEFETGVNLDEVLSRDLQRMMALIGSRSAHLQVLAACTGQKSHQVRLFSVYSCSSCSPAATPRTRQQHV